MINKYALIDKDGNIVNIIAYDPDNIPGGYYTPPLGLKLIELPIAGIFQVGDRYKL